MTLARADTVRQPVQAYLLPLVGNAPDAERPTLSPFRTITHLGTDYGSMGPGEKQLVWHEGRVDVDLRDAEWAGVWHCLEGLADERNRFLDFARCYPRYIRNAYQPKCTGIEVRVRGTGTLKLEVHSPSNQILWQTVKRFGAPNGFGVFQFAVPTEKLRRAKFLNWVAEPGSWLSIDSVSLLLEFPEMPFEKRVFLTSYAKFARCYSETEGIVRDKAHVPVGRFDGVPTSGMFCLATCAAWRMGMVTRAFAEETLRNIQGTVSSLPRSCGLLPHFIRKHEGKWDRTPGSEFSTVDTSLYYHGMLLAAQMLEDAATLQALQTEIEAIDFAKLTNEDGYVSHGVRDGVLKSAWRGWGGETALVLLLARMAQGESAQLKMDKTGKVFQGRGFIAEIQSLFYPQFSSDERDALTGVNWRDARMALLKAQQDHFPSTSAAGEAGVYGLSAGEGLHGLGYVANGTEHQKQPNLIHPHYMLMSGALREDTAALYDALITMEHRGLFPPWGLVENVTSDFSTYSPMIGSLNASFESLGAYHLWAKATGETDLVYEAAKTCPLTKEAIRAFYP